MAKFRGTRKIHSYKIESREQLHTAKMFSSTKTASEVGNYYICI